MLIFGAKSHSFCLFPILLFSITIADALYFSMNNLRVTIPTDRGKHAPIANHSLLTLFVQNESTSSAPRFTIPPTSSFITVSSTGNVYFTDRAPTDGKTTVNLEIYATIDSHQKYALLRLQLDLLPLPTLDCYYIIEDLCFWSKVDYFIAENSKPTALGSLSSPYLRTLCPDYSVDYAIRGGRGRWKLVKRNDYHLVRVEVGLDREKMKSEKEVVEVLCQVENSQGTSWNVTKQVNISVLDVDDNGPQAQEERIEIELPNQVHKGELVGHKELIFHDRDNSSVNNYRVTILEDVLDILEPQCREIVDDIVTKPARTAIVCKLKFKDTVHRVNYNYSVILQVNDTSFVGLKDGEKAVARLPIHLRFPNATGNHPVMLKRQASIKLPSVYPSNTAKIFRTAAPFARITQPDKLENTTDFALETNANWRDTFNVTKIGGIIYVQSPEKLKLAPEYIRLNISYREGTKHNYDELKVHIIDEPTKTCDERYPHMDDWEMCASYKTASKCTNKNTCGLGTGGSHSVAKRKKASRCMWRGEKEQSSSPQITTLYATCTPDLSHCPDAVCDPLEDLHHGLCPQDCALTIMVPTSRNPTTGRGIHAAAGVCYCDDVNCQCDVMPPPTQPAPRPAAPTPRNVTSTERVRVFSLAQCGTSCVLGIVAASLFLGGALVFVVVCWRFDRVNKAGRGKFGEGVPLAEYGVGGGSGGEVVDAIPLAFEMSTMLGDAAIISIINKHAPDPKWEFPRGQLIIEQTLGEGEFGRVLRAKAFNIANQLGETTVAVKTLKEDARETELNDLLSEYQLLKEVSHPNVIRLLGVCTTIGGPIYLIIEFAEFGSLRNYLRRSRHLKSDGGFPTSRVFDESEEHYDEPNVLKITPKEILSFAWQICKGMAYLSEIKLVHRDLAARNVLLAADKICKISDFGLTRDIYEDDAYFKRSKGRVPVKWMAPESLSDHIYTNKSDVWSFGILIWELVTLGATPYPGIAVQNIFHLLRTGYRMERPDNCSAALYRVMTSCWQLAPEQRPTFPHLCALWEGMLADQVDYLDLANNTIHNRSYFCEMEAANYAARGEVLSKCGEGAKLEGYETPVKTAKVMKTPENEAPECYTDMTAASGED